MAIEASPILSDEKHLVQSAEARNTKQLEDRIPLFDNTEAKQSSAQIGYVHPIKIAQAGLNDLVYDLKQRIAVESEAEFWRRNYEESARAQRVWEQKQF